MLAAVETDGTLAGHAAALRVKAEAAGLRVVGEYALDERAVVLLATSDALLAHAAQSEHGAFGACVRLAVARVADPDEFQLSYTNPRWMAAVYRMAGDLGDVAQALATHVGAQRLFGCKAGLPADKLRKYHYKLGMPYFTEPDKLAKFDSYNAAVESVEAGLRAGKGDTRLVCRVDLPGKDETLFAVAILSSDGADAKVLDTCNQDRLSHVAHLPYEIVVAGPAAYALDGKFRIAQSWPDTTMGTFMKIAGAPGGICKSLKAAAKNQ